MLHYQKSTLLCRSETVVACGSAVQVAVQATVSERPFLAIKPTPCYPGETTLKLTAGEKKKKKTFFSFRQEITWLGYGKKTI